MKTAITVLTTKQIGIETWKDISTTKVFDSSATLQEIINWIKTIDKGANLSSCKISEVVE